MQLYPRTVFLSFLALSQRTTARKKLPASHLVKSLAFVPNNSNLSASRQPLQRNYTYSQSARTRTHTMNKTSVKMVTMDSPSAQRNKGPIWSIMESAILPLLRQEDQDETESELKSKSKTESTLRVLEIAGGCGVHTEHFSSEMAKIPIKAQWYATDPDEASLQSLKERVEAMSLPSGAEYVTLSTPFCLTLGSEGTGVLEDSDGDDNANANDSANAENIMSPTITTHAGEDPIDLMICINMIHISPWAATMGLFKVASAHLAQGGILMTYGPYKVNGTAVESNLNFDANLKARNAEWGVRDLEAVEGVAKENGLTLLKTVEMPANNLICIFRK